MPSLTPLEEKVLRLHLQGHTNGQIGHAIGKTNRTIYNYLRRIDAKLEPINPVLIRLALERELLTRVHDFTNIELLKALNLYTPRRIESQVTEEVTVKQAQNIDLREFTPEERDEFIRVSRLIKSTRDHGAEQP